MADNGLEARKLELETRRLEADLEIRRAELAEKRAQRESDASKHATEAELKRLELTQAAGRGLRFTSAQATVAAAFLALVSGALGGGIQAWVSRDVEASKSAALVKIEEVKARASIDLDRQKFETSLITKATESPRREEQIRNLKFYLAAGFLRDPEQKIAGMSEKDYPSSPPPTSASPTPLPPIGTLASTSPIRSIAKSIGLISVGSGPAPLEGFCTGWLVDTSHIVTAAYCLGSKERPKDAGVRNLSFRLGFVSPEEKGDVYRVTGLVEWDEEVGYAVLAVDPDAGKKYGWLSLLVRPAERDEQILIVQHAGGIQLLAAENCTVIDPLNTKFWRNTPGFSHRCRQEPGSGGAPVIAKRDNAVLGIVAMGDQNLEFATLMNTIVEKSAFLKRLARTVDAKR